MTDELVLTVDEAAAALRISRDLVYELIQRGELPSLTLGRRRLVPRKAIDDVLERALEGFDPDRLVKTLAAAVGALPGDQRSAAVSPPPSGRRVPGRHRSAAVPAAISS